jgi:hypothetical protein
MLICISEMQSFSDVRVRGLPNPQQQQQQQQQLQQQQSRL